MKIIYFSAHPQLNLSDRSGYATHMNGMIRAFGKKGHEVLPIIAGGAVEGLGAKRDKKNNLKGWAKAVIPTYFWESIKDYNLLKKNIGALADLTKGIKEFNPDLIYERACYLSFEGIKAANDLGVKHILEVNAPLVEEKDVLESRSYFYGGALKTERSQLGSTSRIVVVSEILQDYFLKKYDLPQSKFIVTPNAVDPSRIEFSQQRQEEIIAEYRLESKTVIGFVGSFFKWHGLSMLISAFKSLETEFSNLALFIVGDGEESKELQLLAGDSLNNSIHFTGNVAPEEVSDYINIIHIATMPASNWYGSPMKIFEYGSLGRAIIAPDEAPLKEVMEHNVDGLLIKPAAESLKQALRELINNDQKRIELGKNFQKKVLDLHTWNHNVDAVLEGF